MKLKKRYIVLLVILVLLVGNVAITHQFGPYQGKVIDAETNQPIEGVVILLRFSTERSTFAGIIHKYADALEIMTDRNGEFDVTYRVTLFRPFWNWSRDPMVVIFKPGYGCYPWHMGTVSRPTYKPKWTLPANQYVTILLPPLKTLQERKENLSNIYPGPSVPLEKQKNLRKLEEIEELNVGL